MGSEQSRRHHYVPQLILRGFGNDRRLIRTFDREDGRSYVQPIRTAAAEIDYNTLTDSEGVTTDVAEQAMGSIEGAAAPVIDRIVRGGWLRDKSDMAAVAMFLALQYVRVPTRREFSDALANELLKLQVAAGGPAQLKTIMTSASGVEPSDDEVLEEWRRLTDFDSWSISMPREHHVVQTLDMVDELAPFIEQGYRWGVVRWQRRALITSDAPVMLIEGPDHVDGMGVGVATAGTIACAIGRRCMLILVNRSMVDVEDGFTMPGTVANARDFNQEAVLHSRRRIYMNPADSLEALLGPDFHVPAPARHVIEPEQSGGLREALVQMSEWAHQHPDEPHPLSRLPNTGGPPPGARPLGGRRIR